MNGKGNPSLNKIETRSGVEGPRHDPYGWTERIVHRSFVTVIHHEGLGEYVEIRPVHRGEPKLVSRPFRYSAELWGEEWVRHVWEIWAGFPLARFDKYHHRLHAPPRRCGCGSYNLDWVDGYPGEQLLICMDCRDVLTASFNEAAVI